jgi:hypothetical protein
MSRRALDLPFAPEPVLSEVEGARFRDLGNNKPIDTD